MPRFLDAFRRLPLIGRLALPLAAVAAAASLYVTLATGGNPGVAGAACAAQPGVREAMVRAARGEVAAFQTLPAPAALPTLGFLDDAGARVTMKQFEGRAVLLNLWATWCAPCRKEMPALDRLQAEMGGKDFEVVAVNIDQRNLDRPKAWLAENGITRLAYYADPETRIFQDLKRVGQAIGMPTTLLIDARGCQLGVLHGPAEWASDDAKALVKAALRR